jgi:putative transposase
MKYELQSSRHAKYLLHAHLVFTHKVALWSRSYFAASVGGAPIEVLRQYIEQQNTPE